MFFVDVHVSVNVYVFVECLEVLPKMSFSETDTCTTDALHEQARADSEIHTVAEPYVVDAQSLVKSLSTDSDKDTSLALNIIIDHWPELTKKQVHTMIGFESCPVFLFLLSSLFSLLSSLFSLLFTFCLLFSSLCGRCGVLWCGVWCCVCCVTR